MTDVSPSRLQRLRELLFDLAAGGRTSFEPFTVDERDELAKLERIVLAFASEFIAAKQHARDLELEKTRVIVRQTELIRSLTAPVIELAEGIVAVPIIGELDEQRALALTSNLLAHLVAKRTSAVLIDLSGASEIGPTFVRDLQRLCRTVGMLGSRCIVTGIRPEFALAITSVGVDLGVRTARSLGDGLRECTLAK